MTRSHARTTYLRHLLKDVGIYSSNFTISENHDENAITGALLRALADAINPDGDPEVAAQYARKFLSVCEDDVRTKMAASGWKESDLCEK